MFFELNSADIIISYSPLPDEPDPGPYLRTHAARGVSVLPTPDIPAEKVARAFSDKYQRKKVAILVPGREFDTKGTRHGRGGGWYDRFLAAVPREWHRVGVLTTNELSAGALVRESWDEPMDALLVWDGAKWDMMAVDVRL